MAQLPEPVRVGIACTPLIADPKSWINRRVETVEMLSHEETRRRVSIDFTLSDNQIEQLTTTAGVVVPISVLSKDPRRNFDLRDEGGRAVPVLGKEDNGELSHIAMMSAVHDALPSGATNEVFEMLWADLRQVVQGKREDAGDALDFFVGSADGGDKWRQSVWGDETCRILLDSLWAEYVLFAVLPGDTPNRRILKYSYGEDFDPSEVEERTLRERLSANELLYRFLNPDRNQFRILCPAAWRARSFHAEIAIPEELRIDFAVLHDDDADTLLGAPDVDVNRASLYAEEEIGPQGSADALVEVSAERHGRLSEAAATGSIVAALLWLGVVSDLDAPSPGPAVSILLGGAALFSGVSASRGEHKLVTSVFSATRRWLFVVTLAALAGAATLAMEVPSDPVRTWCYAATVCTVAAIRLLWSALRAPS